MPVFEVQDPKTGKLYEVEAASLEQAASSFAPQQSTEIRPGYNMPLLTAEDAKTTAKSLGEGVLEGGRRLKAGAVQLGAAVGDYFGRFDKAGRGLQDKVTAEELLRSAVQKAENREAGLDQSIVDVTSKGAQLGTLALAPEAMLPRATTALGAVAKNVISGAMGGAFEFNPESGNKAQDAIIGGALSGVIGLVPSLAPSIKNAIGRGLARVAAEGRTAARVANMEQTLPNVRLSLAQRTGVPELQTLERANYNSQQVNFFADQTDQFIADAAATMQRGNAKNLSQDFYAFRESMSDHIGNIRKTASRQWDVGMNKASELAKEVDPRVAVRIPVATLAEDFKVVNDQAGRVLPSGGKELISPAWLKEMQASLQKGYLTPKELGDTLKGLTALQKDDNAITKALATRLREGLEKDLDLLDQPNPINNIPFRADKTVGQILDTRAEYRRAMQAADALSENAAYKMLGGANGEAPENLVVAFTQLSKGKQESIRDYLEKNSPNLLNSMKQAVMDDAVKKAGVIREAADSQQSLDAFRNALFEGDQLKSAGLWNAADMKKMEGIADGFRTVMNNRPLMGGAGTPIKGEDITTNLISRSDIFLTRQLTRVFNNSSTLSKFFLDDNVYKAMTKISRSTTGSASNIAGRAALLEILQEDY